MKRRRKKKEKEFLIYGQIFNDKDVLENIPQDILKKVSQREKKAIIKAINLTLEAYEQAAEDRFLEKMLT
jgi:hypothetical protein